MGKLSNWREPNWYWDKQFGPWRKKEVLALLRRNWKLRRKIKNRRARSCASKGA